MSFLQQVKWRSPSEISLILFNLIIISIAVIEEWSIFIIVFCYWVENLVIGLYNILKILKAEQDNPTPKKEDNYQGKTIPVNGKAAKVYTAVFFSIHYYLFCLVHGLFVFRIFQRGNEFEDPETVRSIALGILMLIISHGVSFWVNYIKKEEYKKVSPVKQMFSVYKRIAFIHVFILTGGILFMFVFKFLPVIMLVVFMLAKVGLDLWSHVKEHKKAQENSELPA